MLRRFPVLLAVAGVSAVTVLAGCSGTPDAGRSPTVVVGFYPLEFVTERLVGDSARVVDLTTPGVEPHDLELPPQSVAQVVDADLVVYLSGFQPAIDEAVAAQDATAFDVADAADLISDADVVDPHFWLDPLRLASVAEATADELVAQGVLDEATAATNLTSLTGDLQRLDDQFRSGLTSCASRDLVTSHQAFGYLAEAYELRQVGVTGSSPEAEPDPQDLADVTEFALANDVQTVYVEPLVSPDVTETLARETDASVAVLDPLEGLVADASGSDYVSVMEQNLATLRQGQGCR